MICCSKRLADIWLDVDRLDIALTESGGWESSCVGAPIGSIPQALGITKALAPVCSQIEAPWLTTWLQQHV